MAEMIDKWEVVSKLITLQNNYNFFKNEWDAQKLYREIAKLEIGIGKTPGVEVVRCKDCKNWGRYEPTSVSGRCRFECKMRMEDDFCSYGEKRADK